MNLNCLEWVDGLCNKCVTGKIIVYNDNTDKKTHCLTGTALANCHIHKDDADECWYCKDGHYTLDTSGTITCKTTVDDANCVYASVSGCEECKDGYHKDNGSGLCKEMPIKNCEVINGAFN